MKDPRYQELLEAHWRRQLTLAEKAELQAWLKAHPEARADWERETGLAEALRNLSNVPVPTNFSARVLQSVEAQQRQSRTSAWPWRFAWVRAGFATVLVAGIGLFTYQHHLNSRRAEVARSLEAFSDVRMLPGPDAFLNYDAVLHLDQTRADGDLLTAMTEFTQ